MSGDNPDCDESECSALNVNTDEIGNNIKFTDSNLSYFKSTNLNGEIEPANQSHNLTVSSIEDAFFSPEIIAYGAICMILLAIVAIFSNFISIWALSKPKWLKRITTVFVVNLCLADFFLSCCNLGRAIVVYRTQHWNGGDETCKYYKILIFFFLSNSVLTVIMIAFNRYVLIVHPRYYLVVFRTRNTIIMTGLLWIISMVLTLLPLFNVWVKYGYDAHSGECTVINDHGNAEIYTCIGASFIPLVLFILCYVKIFYVVKETERNSSRYRGNVLSYIAHVGDKYWDEKTRKDSTRRNDKHLRNKKERRLFQMIVVIFIGYFLCFIPRSIIKILRKEREYPDLYIITILGVHLHNVVNPVIYIVMSEEYRKAYKELLWRSTENN